MKPAIRIDNLSKQYRIGSRSSGGYRTLRETIMETAAAPWRRLRQLARRQAAPAADFIWALKDVSLEIKPGAVVGVIGRNGAGKTTLLKILSRITEPTSGRVEVRGRLGSLLEVGTGFHHELTGRENVFLNGAILGMKRQEIVRKFDEIVAFSEIEKFIDTPVKRYSSGMYVRLAFAVAAHLEPDILLVDEVLAVGDITFQKKCLAKMHEVAHSGRTVLLVSHNTATVLQICQEAIFLSAGQLAAHGTAADVTQQYLSSQTDSQPEIWDLTHGRRPAGVHKHATLRACKLGSPQKSDAWSLPYGADAELEVHVCVLQPLAHLELGLFLCTATGFELAGSLSGDGLKPQPVQPGDYLFRMSSSLCLRPGRYFLSLGLRSENGYEDYIPEAVYFDVLATVDSAKQNIHLRAGAVIPAIQCSLESSQGLAP